MEPPPPSKRICVAADDRLSDLPDCLIHTILSFLESRQAVRSSVLSPRWRHLWRSVPCIDIDLTVFQRGDRCRDRKCCKTNYGGNNACKKERRPFEQFSDNFLQLHAAPSLDKLRIHVPGLDYSQDSQTCLRWITRGIECSPAVIDIHMENGFYWNYWCLPDLGSTSSRLTRLLLHGVKLDGSFAEHLCSGYPGLEDLRLVKCSCHFDRIMSRRLRHLTIDDCIVEKEFVEMVVTAPSLISLRAALSTTYCPNGIHVTDTSSFVKASVSVISFYQMNVTFFEKLYIIFDVKHLELFGAKMMDAIQWMSDKLPKFHKNCEFSDRSKRRTARAKWRNVALESQNLMHFKCDNLEVIEIKHSKDDNVDEFFELLMGLWRNLGKTSIKLTKV